MEPGVVQPTMIIVLSLCLCTCCVHLYLYRAYMVYLLVLGEIENKLTVIYTRPPHLLAFWGCAHARCTEKCHVCSMSLNSHPNKGSAAWQTLLSNNNPGCQLFIVNVEEHSVSNLMSFLFLIK